MTFSIKTTLSTKLLLFFVILTLLSCVFPALATERRISREEYIDRYRYIAIEHQQRYGIPASITMAQGILESDCGNSELSTRSNNHFGIKCKSNWTGRTVRHTDDAPDECFRAYDHVEHSYEDHAKFLDESPRYDSLFNFSPTDYRSWARGLKGAGYATAPDYAPRLVKIIEDSKLYLLDVEAEEGVKAYDAMLAAKHKETNRKSDQKPASTSPTVDPNNYSVPISTFNGYPIYKTNRTRYTRAKAGDSYKSIAKSFGIPRSSIAKYNDTSAKRAIKSGDVVYLEMKRHKWRGNTHEHRVRSGESVHSLSQSYAIRERSLRKINHLGRRDEIPVGAIIHLK